MSSSLREQAIAIWQAAVDAVKPETLMRPAFNDPLLFDKLEKASRIIVVGAGKAGASMSAALEDALRKQLNKVEGIVNVPADTVRQLQRIILHAARPAGSNHPTAEGVAGAERMLDLFSHAGREDIGICLLSGGGSALLPAPSEGITLADKQAVTKLLHACGANINEMNCVRKHLSRIKGGRLAQAFTGGQLFSLIISDVVGDPLDVIASGPTVADPSTFQDAFDILTQYGLLDKTPANVLTVLKRGAAGEIPDTLKLIPPNVQNLMLGNNRLALDVASRKAEEFGFHVLDLGSYIEGESSQVAVALTGLVRSIRTDHQPAQPPVCILLGGETTVTLNDGSGKGGRNQEFVVSLMAKLGQEGMKNVAIVSGGTDGEDGPTDAAGGVADEGTHTAIAQHGLSLQQALARHDAYPLLDACGGLLRTGITQTNVMDVRVILIAP